jgi:predicted metal-dependent hydrolase
MKYEIDNQEYEVKIIRKNNRNTYMRVKDGVILVTTDYFMPITRINRLLNDNEKQIKKMIDSDKSRHTKDDDFYFLGKKYDIIIMPKVDDVTIDGNVIYTRDNKMLDKWLKREIKVIFDARYLYLLAEFKESNLHYDLKIRKMTSRWGVNNRKSKTITLNTNLIKYDIECLDYVIIHELCHLVYFNHSKGFWNLVGSYVPNYKKIQKELKE